MRHALSILFPQRFGESKVRRLVAIGPKIVRPIVELGSDGLRRHKVLDFNFASRLRLDTFELFVIEEYEDSRLDFKTLLNLFPGHFFAAVRINHVLLDASLRALFKNVKANLLVLEGRVQL